MKTISENLTILNAPRTVAGVLEVLADYQPHTMHDIERKSDLRQPEVSLAIGGALSAYVTVEDVKRVTPGRPVKIVTMKHEAYDEYIDACLACFEAAYDVAKEAAKELKEG